MVCGREGETEPQTEPVAGVMLGATVVITAPAPPVLERVRETAVAWLVLTGFGLALKLVAATAGAVWPVTVAGVAVAGPTAAPELASVPLTVAPNESAAALETVHDQVKVPLPPPEIAWGTGLADPQLALPPDTVGATAVTFAPAWPVSFTVSVKDTDWPTVAVERLAATLALKAAPVCTVRVAWGLAVAPTAAPVLASDPLALPPSTREPALDG